MTCSIISRTTWTRRRNARDNLAASEEVCSAKGDLFVEPDDEILKGPVAPLGPTGRDSLGGPAAPGGAAARGSRGAPGAAARPDGGAPAPSRSLQKLLLPFLKAPWHSEACGQLRFEGDPLMGELLVGPRPFGVDGVEAPSSGSSSRKVMAKGDGILLVCEGGSTLRLVGVESNPKTHVAWEGADGRREIWRRSERAPAAQEAAVAAGAEVAAKALCISLYLSIYLSIYLSLSLYIYI